ncbi:hypothetical protein K1719_047224 [Acacia pycnantha]|nr:hypothetical protein K1719_047224 [Acacia pycnantha]
MIFWAYLTIQPWSLDFDSSISTISKVVVWVLITGLSFKYYHKSTARVIGALLGDVVKIDYRTENRGRGKYARLAVIVDLQKPLIPWLKVDGRSYGVEYEGLPHICFKCGMVGHVEERCGVLSSRQVHPMRQETAIPKPSGDVPGPVSADGGAATPEARSSPYGEWMQSNQQDLAEANSMVLDTHAKTLGTMGSHDRNGKGQENRPPRSQTRKQEIQGVNLRSTKDWRVTWNHVYREGNRCANYLASFALTMGVGYYVLSDPPDGLLCRLRDDAAGAGQIRLCLSDN